MTADMRYMDRLVGVTLASLVVIREKTQTYGDSWKRRGGPGAWFTTVRPWDRLEKIVEKHGGDIFAACAADPTGQDGSALACVRDLTNYLLLIQAQTEVLQGAETVNCCVTCGKSLGGTGQHIFCSVNCSVGLSPQQELGEAGYRFMYFHHADGHDRWGYLRPGQTGFEMADSVSTNYPHHSMEEAVQGALRDLHSARRFQIPSSDDLTPQEWRDATGMCPVCRERHALEGLLYCSPECAIRVEGLQPLEDAPETPESPLSTLREAAVAGVLQGLRAAEGGQDLRDNLKEQLATYLDLMGFVASSITWRRSGVTGPQLLIRVRGDFRT